MFDIGFWELSLIAVVALLVVGPERLPRLARTAGMWLGKARRFLSQVKGEIDREVRAEELKRIMSEQSKSTGMYELVEETRNTLNAPVVPPSERSAAKGNPAAAGESTAAAPKSPSESRDEST
jgi:sec-independent protein translocase protein TatB